MRFYFYVALFALLFTVLPKYCSAGDFKLLEHDQTYVNFKNFMSNGYEPLLPPGHTLNKGVDLHADTTVLKYGYWNNMVWSLADQHQFRWVGWNFQVGLKLSNYVHVEYEHFSKHILDKEYENKKWGRFPVSDSINIKIFLYKAKKEDTLL